MKVITNKQAEEIIHKKNALIEAPAGHGKTEMIADLVEYSDGRMLVLTHTHAGVDALKGRMKRRGISQTKYSVSTIDAFCVKWSEAYPFTSEIDLSLSPMVREQVNDYYKQMRPGAKKVFSTAWAGKVFAMSYSAVIVDEYQDCTNPQHELIRAINEILHVYVFWDPMQSIFLFVDDPLDTDAVFFERYKGIETKPHRWDESNPRLGDYLTKLRDDMCRGVKDGICEVHLEKSDSVEILDPNYDVNKLVAMAEHFSSVVFITKKIETQKNFCTETKGRFQYDETKECRELYFFAEKFDNRRSVGSIIYWIEHFITGCFYIVNGQEFSIAQMENGDLVRGMLLSDMTNMYRDAILSALEWISGDNCHKGAYRPYRTELFEEMIRSLKYAIQKDISVCEAASVIRLNPAYHKDYDNVISSSSGFMLSSRTLLSKGLEFDCVIIDMRKYPDSEWSLDANDFYVAMTRAKKKIYILSPTADLSLKVPQKKRKTSP